MAEKIIRVCDVCEGEDVTLFKIQWDSENLNVDLCAEHAQPIRGLLRAVGGASEATTSKKPAKPSQAPPRASKRASGGIKITSMSDVQAKIRDPFTP